MKKHSRLNEGGMQMNGVQWKVKGLYKADPQKVFDEISSIGDSYTLQQVVDKGRNKDTELHKCFEWNDTVAAEKYRCEQARHVIAMLAVPSGTFTEKHEPIMVRAIVCKYENDNGFEPVTVTVRKEDSYEK
jgi:hypothetical protein